MLSIEDVTYRIGGRTLLERASAQIPDGHRVGLVGRNGTGKTTLLNLIAGDIAPDSGDIRIGGRQRIGTVEQHEPDPARTPIDLVLAADKELVRLTEAAESETDGHAIGEIHARLHDIGAHRAEAKAARILNGLGFTDRSMTRPLGELSGGWRMRVALAGALFAEPEILLLDEPTNHLDLEASLWLESYLARYPYTLVLVSHDRDILNAIPNAILHLDKGRLTLYSGGYDRFERTRAEQQARQSALYTRQQAQRRRIQSFVDRFRYKASKAKQAQSRLKMLEKMQPIATAVDEATVTFDLPKPDILPPPILTLEDAAVGYDPENPVLKRLNLRVDMDDRIALLGANGNGKTTLLRLMSDRMKVSTGRIGRSSKLEVGYFAQNQLDELDGTKTPLSQLLALEPMAVEERLRAHLGRFGFPQDKAETQIASLSGGEKARLALAVICRRRPHLLLLDEPTNHLDIDARESLIQALADYEGAVILVSHDPHLVETTADRLWLVGDGTCTPFDGDFEDYRRLIEEERRSRERGDRATGSPGGEVANRKTGRKNRAEAREKLAPLRKSVAKLEDQLEKLQEQRSRITDRLADPALYQGPAEKLAELNKLAADLDRAIEKTEDAWMTAQEALDANRAAAEDGSSDRT